MDKEYEEKKKQLEEYGFKEIIKNSFEYIRDDGKTIIINKMIFPHIGQYYYYFHIYDDVVLESVKLYRTFEELQQYLFECKYT